MSACDASDVPVMLGCESRHSTSHRATYVSSSQTCICMLQVQTFSQARLATVQTGVLPCAGDRFIQLAWAEPQPELHHHKCSHPGTFVTRIRQGPGSLVVMANHPCPPSAKVQNNKIHQAAQLAPSAPSAECKHHFSSGQWCITLLHTSGSGVRPPRPLASSAGKPSASDSKRTAAASPVVALMPLQRPRCTQA